MFIPLDDSLQHIYPKEITTAVLKGLCNGGPAERLLQQEISGIIMKTNNAVNWLNKCMSNVNNLCY